MASEVQFQTGLGGTNQNNIIEQQKDSVALKLGYYNNQNIYQLEGRDSSEGFSFRSTYGKEYLYNSIYLGGEASLGQEKYLVDTYKSKLSGEALGRARIVSGDVWQIYGIAKLGIKKVGSYAGWKGVFTGGLKWNLHKKYGLFMEVQNTGEHLKSSGRRILREDRDYTLGFILKF